MIKEETVELNFEWIQSSVTENVFYRKVIKDNDKIEVVYSRTNHKVYIHNSKTSNTSFAPTDSLV